MKVKSLRQERHSSESASSAASNRQAVKNPRGPRRDAVPFGHLVEGCPPASPQERPWLPSVISRGSGGGTGEDVNIPFLQTFSALTGPPSGDLCSCLVFVDLHPILFPLVFRERGREGGGERNLAVRGTAVGCLLHTL